MLREILPSLETVSTHDVTYFRLKGRFARNNSRACGVAVVSILFTCYIFYDIGWTQLLFSYGTEKWPYNMRLKGLSIVLSVQRIAQGFTSTVLIEDTSYC